MELKKGGKFILSLILVVLFLGLVSAQGCSITTKANCNVPGWLPILGLSDSQNAHGYFPKGYCSETISIGSYDDSNADDDDVITKQEEEAACLNPLGGGEGGVWYNDFLDIISLPDTVSAGDLENYEADNFNYVLCCDVGTGDVSCLSGAAEMLKLSSEGNAHAEVAWETPYNIPVCSDGFDDYRTVVFCSDYNNLEDRCKASGCFWDGVQLCLDDQGPDGDNHLVFESDGTVISGGDDDLLNNNCPSDFNIPLLSLFSLSNSHIGKFEDYPIKICGKEAVAPGSPGPIAYWASNSDGTGGGKITSLLTSVTDNTVYLVLKNPPANIYDWEFEIWDNDLNGDDSFDEKIISVGELDIITNNPDILIAEWIISQADLHKANDYGENLPFEFYFVVQGYSPLGGTISGDLSGTWERSEFGEPGEGTWRGTIGGDAAAGTWEGGLTITGIKGTWEGSRINQGPVSGEWERTSANPPTGDWDQTSPTNINLGTWTRTTMESAISYSLESKNLYVDWESLSWTPTELVEQTGGCEGITSCSSYKKEVPCALNECVPMEMGEKCIWKGTSCVKSTSIIDPSTGDTIGFCYYTDTTVSSCSEDPLGFLILSWTADWEDTGDQNPPNCVDGTSGLIPCSAQAQLPLTSWFSMVATVMILGGFYFLSSRNKRKKVKKA